MAFVRLWPLNHKTGARSRSLRTGFSAPTINNLSSRVSAAGGGLDIHILIGEDGLAAVAEAAATEAAAQAEAQAVAAAAETGAKEIEVPAWGSSTEAVVTKAAATSSSATVNAAAVETSPSSAPSAPAKKPPGGGMDPAGNMAVDTAGGGAVDSAGGGVDSAGIIGECAVGSSSAAGAEKAAAAPPPRCLALELEIFACGTIDVPYMIGFIKGCFQQVILYMVPNTRYI